jgi:hypothetical protein
LLLSVAVVCVPAVVTGAGPASAADAAVFGAYAGVFADADAGADHGDTGDEHGSGWGPAALLDRMLQAGPVAAPFVMVSAVMVVANRRANRLQRSARAPT